MKRLPLIVNLLLTLALCSVLAFWGLRLFTPKLRPVAAPVSVASYEPGVGQWGTLFGQSAVAEAAPSSYQVKGVIVAPRAHDSAAIIVVEGKPTFTIGVGKSLSPGVVLSEVHADHVIVTESGLPRRIDLPQPPPVAVGVNSVTNVSPNQPVAPVVPPPAPSQTN